MYAYCKCSNTTIHFSGYVTYIVLGALPVNTHEWNTINAISNVLLSLSLSLTRLSDRASLKIRNIKSRKMVLLNLLQKENAIQV